MRGDRPNPLWRRRRNREAADVWPTCATIRKPCSPGPPPRWSGSEERSPAPGRIARRPPAGRCPGPAPARCRATTRDASRGNGAEPPQGARRRPDHPVTRGLLWAAVALDAAPGPPVCRVIVQTQDAAAAQAFSPSARRPYLARAGGPGEPPPSWSKPFADDSPGSRPKSSPNRLVLSLASIASSPWSRSRSGMPRNRSHRRQCVNNLKQIGLAMHNYHSRPQHVPARLQPRQGRQAAPELAGPHPARTSSSRRSTRSSTSTSPGTARTTRP